MVLLQLFYNVVTDGHSAGLGSRLSIVMDGMSLTLVYKGRAMTPYSRKKVG